MARHDADCAVRAAAMPRHYDLIAFIICMPPPRQRFAEVMPASRMPRDALAARARRRARYAQAPSYGAKAQRSRARPQRTRRRVI